ncbi:hypothetical protein AMATHDRAFT_140110 [Amanita thiersii Skay4041]|uniref:L-dopachrome isomerase n=1 Tax=Amanita thiersii Skay4041 TaxID=703135 RepID=A0A2A9NXI6_9AGAR|nr:hypothetical protein AMATHDRAFT_140110 [Amanita thiersii Skay4041]
MPYLQLTTNVKVEDPKGFAREFSKLGAEVLGKPEGYISVSIAQNDTLTFGGSFDPAFQLLVISLDNINPQVNEVYSKKFFQFFKDKLNIPDNRAYITFIDPGRANIAHQSTTFATIFGK